MPKATKEFVLNYAFNRWQLNYPRNVGHLSKEIRKLMPKTQEEWSNYYFDNIRSIDHLNELGEILFDKIKNTVINEERFHPNLIENISLGDCINYVPEVVIKRTYDGYKREFG